MGLGPGGAGGRWALGYGAALLLPLAVPWHGRWDDVGLYAAWGAKLMAHAVPYLDFAVEYPPGALGALLLPAALAHCGGPFQLYFVLWAWAIDGAQRLWAFPPAARTLGRQWLYTALQLPLYAVFFKRLDVFAAALTTVALTALVRRPRAWAPWAWLAGGVLIKLYPLVLAAPMALYAWRRGLSWAALCGRLVYLGGLLAGVLAAAAAWAGPQSLDWVGYHEGRGLQVTSSYVACHLLAGGIGQTLPAAMRFGALEIDAPWAAAAARLAPKLMVLGQVLTLALMLPRAKSALGLYRTALAQTAMLIATAKVLSPQYIVWLLPLGVLALGPKGRADRILLALLLGLSITTSMLYPGETILLAGQAKRQLALIGRCALLGGLWAYLVARPERLPGRGLTLL